MSRSLAGLCLYACLTTILAGLTEAWSAVPQFGRDRVIPKYLRPVSTTSTLGNRNLLQNDKGRKLRTGARDGSVKTITEALVEGADVNATDSNGFSALHFAAAFGHLQAVRVLINAGANLDASMAANDGATGISPLHIATIFNQSMAVRALIAAGANMNIDRFTMEDGLTGLTPLHVGSTWGNVGPVEELAFGGADLDKPDSDGWVPIATATEGRFVDIVNVLIAAGADVNANTMQSLGLKFLGFTFDISALTTLHIATQGADSRIVEALLDAGAFPDATLNTSGMLNGVTALWLASERGLMTIVEALIRSGADVNIPNEMGVSPLVIASWMGHTQTTVPLLARGADVNGATTMITQLTSKTGRHAAGVTPLYAASLRGHFLVFKFLLASRADPNLSTEFGQGPLHVASALVGNSSKLIINDLLNVVDDVNTENDIGWTPIMNAAYYGNIGVVESLLEGGADVSIASPDGETALDLICRCKEDASRLNYEKCPKGGCEVSQTSEDLVSILSNFQGPPSATDQIVGDCLELATASERLQCVNEQQG